MALKKIDGQQSLQPFSEMGPDELAAFDHEWIASLQAGDSTAADESLAAGVPIYYSAEDIPSPYVVKEYPDGHKEIVSLVNGVETILRATA